MPTSKGKQRLPTSGFLGQVHADENGNGVAKRTAGEKNKKVMRLKELRVLLEKKLKYDIGTNARHIRNWAKAKKPYLPPRSPFSLLQELFFYDPWKVLIACMFLNKTSGKQVSTVLYKFFSRYPTPTDLQNSNREDVIGIIKPLGLYNKRADMIVHFTKEYLRGNWRMPDTIKGIGKYANDAYRIFCCGEFKDVQPQDHALNKYHEWLIKEDNKESKEVDCVSPSVGENNSDDSHDGQNPLEISSDDSDDDKDEKKNVETKPKKNSGVKESKSAHHQAFLVAGELKWNIRREDLNITQEERDWWSELFEIRDYFYKKFQNVEIEAQSDEISASEEAIEVEELPKKVKVATKKRKMDNEEGDYNKKSKKKQKLDKEKSEQDKKLEKEKKKREKANKKESKKKKKQIEREDRKANEQNSTAGSSVTITKTNLPPGWRFEIRKRQSGGTKGREDYYWYSPEGKKFRSLVEIRKHLAKAVEQ
jgi:methyl-CpG-binding domain protein 4